MVAPCRTRTVQQEIQMISKAFPQKPFERIWLSLSAGGATCSWAQASPASNCLYLKDLIYNMQVSFGVPVSIIAMRKEWYNTFKDYKACPEVSDQLLWWIPDTFIDQKPDFEDYIPFGGWKIPFAKLFTVKQLCGGEI